MTDTPQQRIKKLDQELRAIQRQNELKSYIAYQRKLDAAYARSKNPHPPKRITTITYDDIQTQQAL